ncbi:MAG: glycerol-3-phosphate 1-O-acyltransferase PlsY [Bacilli bacterium]|nr:glycerol-3-phosphate 1-O-acyltransferase PlsY [Bacilli bacterium]
MDIILYNIVVAFCSLFLGYIFGSIPMGVIVGKVFYHKDPRTDGSKNSGGTNVGRLFGKKAGLIVIFLDMLKCAIPTVGAWAIITFTPLKDVLACEMWNKLHILYIYLAPIGVAIGHCWPIFAGFKGGKAVSNFAGFGILTSWGVTLVGIVTFFSTLKAKKYVSLASILLSIVATIFAWILFGLKFTPISDYVDIVMWGWGKWLVSGWEYATTITIMAILLIYRHKPNIIRLARHEERKITWMK